MKYSIRQLSFGLLLFLGLVSLLLVAVFAVYFYRFSVDRVVEERAITLQTIANTVGSSFWVHQELLHIPGTVENFLQQTAKIEDIVFIRIVNPATGEIEKSNDRSEIGLYVPNDLPVFQEHITIQNGMFNDTPIKELSIISSNQDYLWMGVSLQKTQQTILLTSLFLSIGILALFMVAALLVLLLFDRLITIPLITLLHAFKMVEKEKYDIRLPNVSSTEMQSVFRSFTNTVQEIEKTRERDATVSRLKSEFIALATHQLRTPLSILKWILSQMLEGDVGKISKKQQEALEKANITNERMIALVNDLLNVVQIEEGRFRYSFVEQPIGDIIERIIEEMKILAQRKGITLMFLQPQRPLPAMSLDKEKLRLALENLIENAIRYTRTGGRITVSAKQQNDNVLFTVQDTGIGISETEMKRVFEKFFRGRRAIQEDTVGNGLGLFIAKNIIQRHKGEIRLESEIDKGTTIYVTLPIKNL